MPVGWRVYLQYLQTCLLCHSIYLSNIICLLICTLFLFTVAFLGNMTDESLEQYILQGDSVHDAGASGGANGGRGSGGSGNAGGREVIHARKEITPGE